MATKIGERYAKINSENVQLKKISTGGASYRYETTSEARRRVSNKRGK